MNAVEKDIAVSGDARIAVIGIGGAGVRIASMLYGKMSLVGVIAINTDRKALETAAADTRLYICKEVTKGLGTNGDPALGKKCAQIHEAEITAAVSKYDYAYIIAGMGGGTGSGAASVVAELCDRAGVKVGAITIMPFGFETGRSIKAAEGFRALHEMIVRKVEHAIEDGRELIRQDIAKRMCQQEHSSPVTETFVTAVYQTQKSL